jgi:capsular polysaccharide export protein
VSQSTIASPSWLGLKNRPLPTQVFAYNFSRRKRALLRRFIGEVRVRCVNRVEQVPPEATLLVWGDSPLPAGLAQDVWQIHVEDGFLRSIGLGADLVRPISWVLDHRGIYYDATRPSDLEHLLLTEDFAPDLLERAGRLRRRIVGYGLTKYNVGGEGWERPVNLPRVILVPGQVETDASIRFGTPGIRTNMGLLRAVSEANPEAYVVYKPHPDVVAGLRAKGQREDEAPCWCDEVVTNVAMGDLLLVVDEVHVLTSLTGFEALLRGKIVVCYGHPFYAGWGLTRDIIPLDRRDRSRSLDELSAAVLILYPRYLSRMTGQLTTPEQAMDELLTWRNQSGGGLPLWRKAFRVILRHVVGVR